MRRDARILALVLGALPVVAVLTATVLVPFWLFHRGRRHRHCCDQISPRYNDFKFCNESCHYFDQPFDSAWLDIHH